MNFSSYIFRSHMVGHIIDVPKPLTQNQSETLNDLSARFNGDGKPLTDKQKETFFSLQNKYNESLKYTLTDSTKKTLSRLVFAEKYGRKVELNSPQISKGLEVEKNARDVLSRVSGMFLTPCEERKTNKWVTGKLDVDPQGVIIDIKSSWSWDSYSTILESSANEIYLRQGDSYMDLWNMKDFILCHILVDTPSKLVEGEIRRYDYQNMILDFEGNVKDECIGEVVQVVSNHIFSRKGLEDFCDYSPNIHIEWFDDFKEIPEHERVHMVPHTFDLIRIEQRNECISLAREYMNTVRPINNFQPSLLLAEYDHETNATIISK